MFNSSGARPSPSSSWFLKKTIIDCATVINWGLSHEIVWLSSCSLWIGFYEIMIICMACLLNLHASVILKLFCPFETISMNLLSAGPYYKKFNSLSRLLGFWVVISRRVNGLWGSYCCTKNSESWPWEAKERSPEWAFHWIRKHSW